MNTLSEDSVAPSAPTTPPSAAAVQVGRITGLNDVRAKTVAQSDADLGRLVRMLVMGTDRILVELRKQIEANKLVDPSAEDLEFQTSAVLVMMPFMESLHANFFGMETAAQALHASMQWGTAESYLAQFESLTKTIETAFVEMESAFAILQSKLTEEQKRTGYFQSLSGMVNQARGMFQAIAQIAKEEIAKAGKVIGVVALSANVALASTHPQTIERIIPIMPENTTIVPLKNLGAEEIPFLKIKTLSEARAEFFRDVAEKPEILTTLPHFQKRAGLIKKKLAGLKYESNETWKAWNKGVTKSFLSNLTGSLDTGTFVISEASDTKSTALVLTEAEEKAVIKGIQKLVGAVDDGMFGPKSKHSFLAHFEEPKPATTSVTQVKQTTQETTMSIAEKAAHAKAITGSSDLKTDLILRQVPQEEFDEALLEYVGTRYRRGTTDCSGILRMAMKKLGLIDPTFRGNSRQIMDKLAGEKRKIMSAQSGDFLFWKSARSRNSRATHIAYVMSVEKLGVWILDSSTDVKQTARRFLDWKTLSKKTGYAGAAKILVQATARDSSPITASIE